MLGCDSEYDAITDYTHSYDENGTGWYIVNSNKLFYGPIDDNPKEWLTFVIDGCFMDEIRLSFNWKDQGWGNMKGMLSLNLKNEEGSLINSQSLVDHVAPHNLENITVTFDSNYDIVNKFSHGCIYEIMRYVGDGGGHTLTVQDFKIAFLSGNVGLK